MSLYPNCTNVSLFRARSYGPDLLINTNLSGGAMRARSTGPGWSDVNGGTPVGVGVGALSMPLVRGSMSGLVRVAASVPDAAAQEGRPISGDAVFAFAVDPADMLLTALLSGSGSLTITLAPASLGAAVGVSGGTSFALTPGTPLLGAIAGLFGAGAFVTASAGTLTATGSLSGHISPYTELSPENLAASVWAAVAGDNNDPGSMGSKLNSAAAGGVDLNALAQVVWQYASRTLTAGGASPTAEEVAAAVLAAAAAAPIAANVEAINGAGITGAGVPGNEWGPA